MKISSTPAAPVSVSAGRPAAAATAARSRDQGAGFLNAMQEGMRNGYLEIPICDLFKSIVETDTTRFFVETKVGDDAVRFDARPIVAPTTGKGDETGPAAAPPVVPAETPVAPPASAIEQLVSELAQRMPVIAREIDQANQHLSRAAPSPATGPSPALRSSVHSSPATVNPTNRRASPIAAAGRSDTASALRYVPDPAASATRTLTRVTMLPREVFVLLRGISLSAEDSMVLSEKIRSVLGQYQLGDRMVKIVGTGKGA